MTTNSRKATLRAAVLPLLNSGISESTVLGFIDTVTEVCNPNASAALSPIQVRNVLKGIECCDVACGFGPGHQSTAYCDRRGPHEGWHRDRSCRLEWDEKRLGEQTIERRGKTYRLAFSDEGWC